MRDRRNSGMWEYLKSTGALDKGEEAILAAKKEWRRIYNTRYKAERRKHVSLHVISLQPKENEHLKLHAKKHDMGISAFIKKSALAYTDLVYVVRDQATVRKIEAILVRSLSAIEEIGRGQKKKGWFARDGELDEAKRIIANLRSDVMHELMKPGLLMKTVSDNPSKWQDILNLINDSKDHRG